MMGSGGQSVLELTDDSTHHGRGHRETKSPDWLAEFKQGDIDME
jgi:hypothetical protein